MTLTPEQRTAVAQWVAAGESLAAIQRKLNEELKLSMTYMEVRFLVDDLGLELKSPAPAKPVAPPPPPAPVEPPAKKGLFNKLKDAVTGKPDDEEPELVDEPLDEELPADLAPEEPAPAGISNVKVEVDRLMRPGTLVSGNVTFSDGVTAKWAMDQYGRLMLDAANKAYKPAAADIQAFQTELGAQLQRMGY